MLYFKSFSSGSCGNCYYLGNGEEGILMDAGVSPRRVKQALQADGMSMDAFSAMLVTHDHLDHIRSLGAFCKRFPRPVFATPTLHKALARHSFTRDYIDGCRAVLAEEGETKVGPYFVRWFEVPHDATQTVGYQIRTPEGTLVLMTDVGRITDEAIACAREADYVVMESNYDVEMLMGGPYPYDLKMRICQGHGHLSNDAAAEALERYVHPGLRYVFLCHLSEHNNTPQRAREANEAVLDAFVAGAACSEEEFPRPILRVLPRQVPSPLFRLD
ncbi:MAG: MBL fold metallo-hydrolase [Bacteroidales bacterium]|nr:MBL fold metallo-hydrolase [Bacteroidales bacterium]